MKRLIAAIILATIMAGCSSEEYSNKLQQKQHDESTKFITNHLPAGATNITDIDNGWYIFVLDDNKFMIRVNSTHGSCHTVSITQV